jgi:hypothetical protein
LVRKAFYLRRDECKSPARFARARRLDRRVEREQMIDVIEVLFTSFGIDSS